MKTIIYIAFIICTTSILGQETSFVMAENGLIIRENPDLKSERIGKLSYGTKVRIIKETGIELEITDGKKNILGQWIEVQEIDGTQKGYVFSGYLKEGEIFTLIEPNISNLKRQVRSGQSTEVIYNYLLNNYEPTGEKFDLEYYDWNKSKICSFSQEFQTGIKYAVFECKEAGGITVDLKLPKVNRKHLMNWIEKIYEVDKMDIDQNVWKDDNSKFEPEEINPGCYYKIQEKEKSTFVKLYCGC